MDNEKVSGADFLFEQIRGYVRTAFEVRSEYKVTVGESYRKRIKIDKVGKEVDYDLVTLEIKDSGWGNKRKLYADIGNNYDGRTNKSVTIIKYDDFYVITKKSCETYDKDYVIPAKIIAEILAKIDNAVIESDKRYEEHYTDLAKYRKWREDMKATLAEIPDVVDKFDKGFEIKYGKFDISISSSNYHTEVEVGKSNVKIEAYLGGTTNTEVIDLIQAIKKATSKLAVKNNDKK